MKHGIAELRRKPIMLGVLVLVILGLNVSVAYAHNWWYWCWHTGRTINVHVFGSYQNEANVALNDWDSHTDVNFNRVSSHTELSVYGAYWGNVTWGGLATIKHHGFDWWHHWRYCKIRHAHATYNTKYSRPSHDIHGIFCMEVGHTLGLRHSNDGCMGKWYYTGNNLNHTVPHNWSDINRKF